MKLSQNQKIILGIFTALPFIIFPFILWNIFQFVVDMVRASDHGEPTTSDIFAGLFSFILPAILSTLLSLALLIYYIIHAVSNKSISSAEQLVWILLFIFIGIVAFPIYWIMRIWNTENKA